MPPSGTGAAPDRMMPPSTTATLISAPADHRGASPRELTDVRRTEPARTASRRKTRAPTNTTLASTAWRPSSNTEENTKVMTGATTPCTTASEREAARSANVAISQRPAANATRNPRLASTGATDFWNGPNACWRSVPARLSIDGEGSPNHDRCG